MKTPTVRYNAWRQVGGYGRDVLTWSDPENIVFLIRNDLASYIDVNVLASAFNIDKSTLMGNIIYVNDFDQYNNEGVKIFDGSKIVGMIADRDWFRIKEQEITMDEFYNANNRTWQYYLNVVRMYGYSLFANGLIFATEAPEVPITALEVTEANVTVNAEETKTVSVITTPLQANTPVIEVESSDENVATVTIDGKVVTISGVAEGTTTITVSAGNVSTEIAVTVPAE